MATVNNNKAVTYLNKDFNTFRQALIDFAKTYYPSTYNDFSAASPGTMLIEMASYVGDVLSYYVDSQIQENFLQYAKQRNNLYTLAYMFGYKPKVTNAAVTNVDIYQIVPAKTTGSVVTPDFDYSLIIQEGSQLQSNSNSDVVFYINDKVDFSLSGSYSPTSASIYSVDNNNVPTFYLLKKSVEALSGTPKSTTFTFGAPASFPTVIIEDTNIIEITSVSDSDGNVWYEVPYLAQSTIYKEVQNTEANDPNLSQYNNNVNYLLRLIKTSKRFVTRFNSSNQLELQFGAGLSTNDDKEIVPDQTNVGMGIYGSVNKLTTAFDPSNFLVSDAYGIAPSNTTLTVNYLVGGGAISNTSANTLTVQRNITTAFVGTNLNSTLSGQVIASLAFTNPSAATGGGDGDDVNELRFNTISQFPTQLRAVTKDDYLIRALSLPSKYGVISKAYVTQDLQSGNKMVDPLSLSLYLLSYNINNQLTPASPALKENLRTYLSQYRMLSDEVLIKDAFIINIGIDFDIVVRPNYVNRTVLANCINALKSYFDITKWQVNQPIILGEVYSLLDSIDGVQLVQTVRINNLVGEGAGYSQYSYDINGATLKNVVYPSLDPSIFEIKYPDTDIQGRVVTY